MFNYRKEIDELFAIQFRVDNKVITIYLGGGMYNKILQNFITFHQFEITTDLLEHVNNILLFQSTKCRDPRLTQDTRVLLCCPRKI